ncbi:hypothetical protein V1264_018062 [Littorina saxatilis]|uniref:Uncharacterized protein n=1 Tax=Littorina saxatilis TaxID=31220 RepID=A0AAN9GBP8_9CAEN
MAMDLNGYMILIAETGEGSIKLLGSPADRAELEVGDEIVEVNGKCVDRCAHSHIIAHIHQCIRSKSIRLRVKRLKEGETVPTISKVHDAYIIAVEENARRKLHDVSANHRVVPVDMTKGLPVQQEEAVTAFRAEQQVRASSSAGSLDTQQSHKRAERPRHLLQHNQQPLAAQDTSALQPSHKAPRSSSPAKPRRQHNHNQQSQPTTQPPHKYSQQHHQQQSPPSHHNSHHQQQQQPPAYHLPPPSEEPSPPAQPGAPGEEQPVTSPSIPPSEGPSPPAQPGVPGEQLPVFSPSIPPSEGLSHPVQPGAPGEHHPITSPSMPVAEKKRKTSSPARDGSVSRSVETLDMNAMMERERESPRKGKGRKGEGKGGKATSNPDTPLIEDMMSGGGLSPNGKTSSHNSLNQSSHDVSMYDMDSDPGFTHSQQNSFSDTGPHREMAIDCPESFIATVKSPPRYPPPNNGAPAPLPRVPPTTPSKKGDGGQERARTDAMLSDAAYMVAGGDQNKPTNEQLERLRKHQDELRKRREEESRHQQEQDFLRSSLRESKKLQALENRRMAQATQLAAPPVGIVNTAFIDAELDDDDDEGELVDDIDGVELSVPQERYLKKNAGVEDLLSTLHHIRSRLNSADNTSSSTASQEVFFLKHLFHNPNFQQAVAMHHKMVEVTSRSPQPRPLGTDSQELAADITSSSPGRGAEPALKELVTILNKPRLKNLLKAHDEVGESQTHPILHTSESDLIDHPLVQYGEESVKIIHLEKTNEHLGATVKNEGDSVIIARIVQGGAAEKSGLLHEGDEILDVNGIDMRGKNVNEVSEMLANMSGTITFMIIPAHTCVEESGPKSGEIMHLRALFNYDPEDDPYIPCRELGISFLKGDILHAIQLTDPNWWQAHREGEEEHHLLAGLIPSKCFQEQRESIRQQLVAEGKENKKRGRMCACGRKERKKKKKKKSLYNGGVGEDAEEILTYEEVTKYYPQPNRKRPIVLVGPPDVGRQELRERIMASDFDRFAAAVPHTSRSLMAGEHNTKDYHFISRSVFEADMLSGKFIEYGEYQNNLYGTSVTAVRQVINQGRICILNLQPESLKILRETDLKPYIIFISPPNMEKLRQLQMAIGKPRPTDEALKDVIEKGREMEETYGHYFDYVLVNMDLDRSYDELLQEINRIETEPQWVPIHWINNGYM